MASRLILASRSPRRVQLLRDAGYHPDAIEPADVDETPRPRERPRDLAARLACAKAAAVAESFTNDFVLGADTVVACGRRVLEKPVDEAEAGRFLTLLSGRRHSVLGGIALAAPGGAITSRVVETSVAFKRLDAREIDFYLASGEWRGKAGGYAIQGRAGQFVRQLGGSYTNVVGLAVYETAQLLKGHGLWPDPDPDPAEAER